MKRKKRIWSLVVALALIISICIVPASAVNTNTSSFKPSTDYPMVFIHGYLGWGSYDLLDQFLPHMGMSTGDTAEYLRSQGYTVVKPSVGPLCSAWDRACELYAELTGTRTDYGEAHSKKYGHERYGRDYTGKGLLENYDWSATNKLNLFGHSFGGATERTFVDILADGRAEEVEAAKAAGTEVSPFFEGGKGDWIYSVTMLAAPSAGSTFCEANPFMREFITGLVKYVTNILNVSELKGIFDAHLDQFGLEYREDETIIEGLERVLNSDFMDHNDNALADLWVDRATDMNKELQLQPNIYYQSFYGCVTEIEESTGNSVPTDRMWLLFRPMARNMGKLDVMTKGSYQDGYGEYEETVNVVPQYLGREWQPNDGMVNMVSGYCPFRLDANGNRIYDKHTEYVEGMEVQPGQWYIMPMQNIDHVGFAGGFFNEDTNNIQQFYVNALNNLDKFANSSDANCVSASFGDISKSAWYHEEVDYVLEKGIMAGVDKGTFSPGTNVSRAQICQILYAMAGKPSVSGNSFSDVKGDEWFADAVNWCAKNKVVAGYDDGTFRPMEDVTREQLAVILRAYTTCQYNTNRNKMIHVGLDTFADAGSVSSWAKDAVAWAAGKRIIAGRGIGNNKSEIAPAATATRAEVAQMITSFCMQIAGA